MNITLGRSQLRQTATGEAMYLGHLAAGLLLKARVPEAPLGWLLFASIWLDLLCGVLLMLRVEHLVFDGPLTYAHVRADVDYSHALSTSLVSALAFAVLGGIRWRKRRIMLALALATLSHFMLDALSHRPDMAVLGFGASRDIHLGSNLALYPIAFFCVEFAWCMFVCRVFDATNRRLFVTTLGLFVVYTNMVFGVVPVPAMTGPQFGAFMIVVFAATTAVLLWAIRRSGSRAPAHLR